MKYAEHIPAVHYALRETGESPGPLLEATSSAASISEVHGIVKRALRFSHRPQDIRRNDTAYKLDPKAYTALDSVLLNQNTRCIGYAVTLSECLTNAEETVGPHYLMFANGHALMTTVQDSRVRAFDVLKRYINADVTSNLDGPTSSLLDQIHDPAHPRGVMRLNTNTFATRERCTDQLVASNSWLYVGDRQRMLQSSYGARSKDSGEDFGFRLIASIYEASLGRQVFEDYGIFHAAIQKGNTSLAMQSLERLNGLYPDIDIRRPQTHISILVGNLAASGMVREATEAIKHYTSSFARSNDSRVTALEAKLYANIATKADDPDSAVKAIDTYERAVRASKHTWAPRAWQHAAERLRRHFTLTPRPTILT